MMKNRFAKQFMIVTAAAMVLSFSGASANASIIVSFFQEQATQSTQDQFTFDTQTDAYSSSGIPAPIGISSNLADAKITGASVSPTSVGMTYDVAIASNVYDGTHVARVDLSESVTFTVDVDTPYRLSLSGFADRQLYDTNTFLLANQTTGVLELLQATYDGSAIVAQGVLHAGDTYFYQAAVSFQLYPWNGMPTEASISGAATLSTASVPEPSSVVLAGFGGIGLVCGALRRRRISAVV